MDGFGHPFDEAPAPGRGLETLFKRHQPWLARVLARRYGAQAAEDLAQETFLKLARAGGFAEARHPRAFLMRIARNAAIDQFRRQRREHGAGGEELQIDAMAAPPRQQQLLLAKQVILALPPKLRDVFILSQIEGMTYGEIAQLRGVSVKTVEWRMKKALIRCAAALKD